MAIYNGDDWRNAGDDGTPESWVQRTRPSATLKFDVSATDFETFKADLEYYLSDNGGINRFQDLSVEKAVEKFTLIAKVSWQPSEDYNEQKTELSLVGGAIGGDLLNADRQNIQDTGLEI